MAVNDGKVPAVAVYSDEIDHFGVQTICLAPSFLASFDDVPLALAEKFCSDQFKVRIPPQVYTALALPVLAQVIEGAPQLRVDVIGWK